MSLSKLIEEKRKERIRQENKKDAKKVITGLAIGSAIGALGGILLSPKSGKENIEDLKGKAKELSEKIKTKSNITKDNIVEAKEKVKDYIENKKSSSETSYKISEEKDNLEEDK